MSWRFAVLIDQQFESVWDDCIDPVIIPAYLGLEKLDRLAPNFFFSKSVDNKQISVCNFIVNCEYILCKIK